MKLQAIYSPNYLSNEYLLESDMTVLIDAGQYLRDESLKKKLDAIILTHVHQDHIEAANRIRQDTGCRIWTGKVESQFYLDAPEKASLTNLFGSDAPKLVIDRGLEDGELIDMGDVQMEVIHTPGHTPGAICLYEPDSKSLFSGDTIFCPGIGRYDLYGGDLNSLRSSITKLKTMDIESIYPGHGPSIVGGANDYLKGISI